MGDSGRVIEQRGISLEYRPINDQNDVRAILGSREEWDASVDNPSRESESGLSPHHAIAKLIVTLAMTHEAVGLPLNQATNWLAARDILVDILTKNSIHHAVVEIDPNHFRLRFNQDQTDLEHCVNLVDIARSIDGEFLDRLSLTTEHDSGMVTEIEFWLL